MPLPMTPLFSVILPCYNHGVYLREAIASLEQSEETRWEAIIVNDGSTDPETLAFFEELRQRGYRVHDQANGGLAQARNVGIELAQGEYILPLDADNKIRPHYLRQSAEILAARPEVGVVYGDMEFFGEQIGRWELPEFSLYRLLLANFIDACSVFRKTVWQQVGGFDENMPDRLGYEDWEFWLAVAGRGWQFARIPAVVFDYRVRSDSMVARCKQPENQQKLVRYLCQKHQALYAQFLPDLLAEKEFLWFREQERTESLRQRLQMLETRLEKVERAFAQSEAERAAAQLAVDRLQVEVTYTRAEAEQWRERVRAMESSKFWRLRQLWFWLKRRLGWRDA